MRNNILHSDGSDVVPRPLSSCVQVAYVTTDVERAKAMFEEVYGVENWLDLGTANEGSVIITRDGNRIVLKGAIAYVGNVQFELLQPVEDAQRIYLDFLPVDGSFAVRFHHLGFNLARDEHNPAFEASMRENHAIPLSTDSQRMPVFYADAREQLGHYLEYFSLPADFDGLIPRN